MALAGNIDAQGKFGYTYGRTVENQIPIIIPSELSSKDALSPEQYFALQESEELFRRIANTAPVMIWMSGLDKLCTYFNQPWLQFTGRPLDAELGNGWAEGVHPEDLERCLDTYTKAFDLHEPFRMEYRLRRHDGEYRWILDSGVPIFNEGSFAGYIGSAFDVTESKLTEDALSRMGQRLIEVQETERSTINEELRHCIDSLLSLSVYLDYLQQHPPQLVVEVHQEFKDLRQEIKDIVGDMEGISRRLQSSTLEYLGIAAAATSLCKQLSDLENVEIAFHSERVPDELPKEISYCLYHVLQEALDSAIKYSGSRVFEVSLHGQADEIILTVHDWGIDFDAALVSKRHALGIAMKQRLQLVGGNFLIESEAQRGTTIRASVPLLHGNGQLQQE